MLTLDCDLNNESIKLSSLLESAAYGRDELQLSLQSADICLSLSWEVLHPRYY